MALDDKRLYWTLSLIAGCTFNIDLGTSDGSARAPSEVTTPAAATMANSCSDPAALHNCFNPFYSASDGTGTPNSQQVIDSGVSASAEPMRRGSDSSLPPPEPADRNWPSFGRDLAQTRNNSSEDRISRASGSDLRELWQVEAPAVTGTPAIVDGVVYWADWEGVVSANNVDDGLTRWQSQLGTGVMSSPCVSGDVVYVADRSNSVYAMDRETGATLWLARVAKTELSRLWSSPLVLDDLLIIGVGGLRDNSAEVAEFGILALNAPTGERLWFTNFANANLDIASAADLGQPVIWSTAAVDAERGLAFIAGAAGRAGEGPLVGFDVLIALRYQTGELLWTADLGLGDAPGFDGNRSEVVFHPDAAPMLFSMSDSAEDVVGLADGTTYRAFMRDTGQLLWAYEFAPNDTNRSGQAAVTSAAYAGGKLFVAFTDERDNQTITAMDPIGKAVWTTDRVMMPLTGLATANGVLFAARSALPIPEGMSRSDGSAGELLALDTDTGVELARQPLQSASAGAIAIANGKVFVGSGFSFEEGQAPVGFLQVFGPP